MLLTVVWNVENASERLLMDEVEADAEVTMSVRLTPENDHVPVAMEYVAMTASDGEMIMRSLFDGSTYRR